ncbi:unnamed protein product [Effrenium voratum]|nr:unnamed protein product [Effrenium voratum]
MVHLPPGICIYMEVGRKAGKRDLHASRSYATEAFLLEKFPKVPPDQQSLNLLYPILGLVSQGATQNVIAAPLQCGERRFAMLKEEEVHSVSCGRCQKEPVRGPCHQCQDCPNYNLCQACFQNGQPHHASHQFRRRAVTERCALALRLMHAYQQEHPRDPARRLLDFRPRELAGASCAATYVDEEGIDVRRFPDPSDPEATLHRFLAHFQLEQVLSKAQQELALRRVSLLAGWMASSILFKSDTAGDGDKRLGSLLVESVGNGLRQLSMGEELCLHFVPTYTRQQQEDFQIFVPSLAWNPELPKQSICPRGPDCACNTIRRRLLNDLPRKVLVADASAASFMLLESALEDERQGMQALACAIGVPISCVEAVLREEGYVLTRDFTSKILELLARWRGRFPAILVGESGTGKTRALQLLTRLLLESQEVRPNLPWELFEFIGNRLRQAKFGGRDTGNEITIDDSPDDPVVLAVDEAKKALLEQGFTLQSFQELLRNENLYAPRAVSEMEPLVSRAELLQWLVARVRDSPRFDVGLFHFMVRGGECHQWRSLNCAAQTSERAMDSLAVLRAAAGEQPEEEATAAATLEVALRAVAALPPEPFLFKLQIHAAMTAEEVQEQLEPALRACKREPQLVVVAFLDEVNTSSCLGLVKAMFCDSLLGTYPNLFLVAAANPYREEATTEDLVVRGSRTVMRDFFQVHPLPPSFDPYIWNWKSPMEADEERYALLLLRKMADQEGIEMQQETMPCALLLRFLMRSASCGTRCNPNLPFPSGI